MSGTFKLSIDDFVDSDTTELSEDAFFPESVEESLSAQEAIDSNERVEITGEDFFSESIAAQTEEQQLAPSTQLSVTSIELPTSGTDAKIDTPLYFLPQDDPPRHTMMRRRPMMPSMIRATTSESIKGLARGTLNIIESAIGTGPQALGQAYADIANTMRRSAVSKVKMANMLNLFEGDEKSQIMEILNTPVENPAADQINLVQAFIDSDRASLQADPKISNVGYMEMIRNGDIDLLTRKLISETFGIVPSMAASIAGFLVGNVPGAIIAGGLLEAASEFEQEIDQGTDPSVALKRSGLVGFGAGALGGLPFMSLVSKYLPRNAIGTAVSMLFNGFAEAGTEVAEGILTPIAKAMINHKDDKTRVQFRGLWEDIVIGLKEELPVGPPSFIAGMFGVSGAKTTRAQMLDEIIKAEITATRIKSAIEIAEAVETLAPITELIPSKSANNPVAQSSDEISAEIDNAAKSVRSTPVYEKFDRVQALLGNVFDRLGTNNAPEPTTKPVGKNIATLDLEADIVLRKGLPKQTIEEFAEANPIVLGNVEPVLNDIMIDLPNTIERHRGEVNWGNILGDKSVEAIREASALIGANEDSLQIIDSWIDRPERFQTAFDGLTEQEQELGHKLKDTFDTLWIIANEAGVLNAWIENYTPHLYKGSKDRTNRILGGGTSGGLSKNFNRAKQRTIEFQDDARLLGLIPITDPALKIGIYVNQLTNTIANKNAIDALKNIEDKNGMKLLSTMPKKDTLARKEWERKYEFVNIPSLQKFMFIAKRGKTNTKNEIVNDDGEVIEGATKLTPEERKRNPGMLVKVPVKAEPDVAKILNDNFAPGKTRGKINTGYRLMRNTVKRMIMINPAIHGTNILSDVLDEMNFSPSATARIFARGKEIAEHADAVFERAILGGIEQRATGELSKVLRGSINSEIERVFGPTAAKFLSPLTKLEEASDKLLFGSIVGHAQLGLFEHISGNLEAANNWDQAKADKVAAHYINTLLGTLPNTWMSRSTREAGSALAFARNWTFSNADIIAKALSGGRLGFGRKILTREEQQTIGNNFAKHLVKGTFGLIIGNNIMQLMFITITNDLKKRGLLDGEQVELHATFSNERRHFWDIDTGMNDKKGQRMFLVGPMFRYMKDYFGFAEDIKSGELQTAWNKLEPILKSTIEQFTNYSKWQHDNIFSGEDTTYNKLKRRAEYFIEGLTPMRMFMERPGRSKTKFEWIVPFLGLWIRRGAAGGPIAGELRRWKEKNNIADEPISNEVNELLQDGKWQEGLTLAVDSGLVKSIEGLRGRLLRVAIPLTNQMRNLSDNNTTRFLIHLEKELGITEEGVETAMQAELNASGLAGD